MTFMASSQVPQPHFRELDTPVIKPCSTFSEALLLGQSAKIVLELDFNFNVRERELPSVTRCLDVIYLCDDVQKLQTNMCVREE